MGISVSNCTLNVLYVCAFVCAGTIETMSEQPEKEYTQKKEAYMKLKESRVENKNAIKVTHETESIIFGTVIEYICVFQQKWITAFVKREGRQPGNDDKSQIRGLFEKRRDFGVQLNVMKDDLAKLKTRINDQVQETAGDNAGGAGADGGAGSDGEAMEEDVAPAPAPAGMCVLCSCVVA